MLSRVQKTNSQHSIALYGGVDVGAVYVFLLFLLSEGNIFGHINICGNFYLIGSLILYRLHEVSLSCRTNLPELRSCGRTKTPFLRQGRAEPELLVDS